MSIRRTTEAVDRPHPADVPRERPAPLGSRQGATRVGANLQAPTTRSRAASHSRPDRIDGASATSMVREAARLESATKVGGDVAEKVEAAAREDAARHYFELMDRAFSRRRVGG